MGAVNQVEFYKFLPDCNNANLKNYLHRLHQALVDWNDSIELIINYSPGKINDILKKNSCELSNDFFVYIPHRTGGTTKMVSLHLYVKYPSVWCERWNLRFLVTDIPHIYTNISDIFSYKEKNLATRVKSGFQKYLIQKELADLVFINEDGMGDSVSTASSIYIFYKIFGINNSFLLFSEKSNINNVSSIWNFFKNLKKELSNEIIKIPTGDDIIKFCIAYDKFLLKKWGTKKFIEYLSEISIDLEQWLSVDRGRQFGGIHDKGESVNR